MMEWMFPFVNAIVTLLHCIHLMQRLRHTLLDLCMYLMVQRYLWQVVHTRSVDELECDIPKGSVGRGHGQAPRGN
jgi:hypothetical protein